MHDADNAVAPSASAPTSSGRRVRQVDIAAAAGVSVSAVSIALQGKPGLSPKVRERIMGIVEELGYRADPFGVGLRTGRSNVLGLCIRNLRNPFFLDVIEGFDETCDRRGVALMIGSSNYSERRESQIVGEFIGRNVDALAIAPIGGSGEPRRWIEEAGRSMSASGRKRPIALLNAASTTGVPGASYIHVDSVTAVILAVSHLVNLGHERIALLAAPRATSPDNERLETYERLMAEHGFEPYVIESRLRMDDAVHALSLAFARPAKLRPTAVITNSDYLAQAAYVAARDIGLRIPDQLSVCGHDDLPTAALMDPPLTTLAVNRRRIGELAATVLLDQAELSEDPAPAVDGENTHTLSVQLVVRASTAPPG